MIRATDREVRRLKVGDKVTTEFRPDESGIVRTVLEIVDDRRGFGSGRGVRMSDAPTCACCNRPFYPMSEKLLDAYWALPMDTRTPASGRTEFSPG
jgi:hypothetical protein